MATNVTAPTTIQRPPTNVSIPRNATFPFGPRSNVTTPGLDGFTVNIALTYQDNLRFSHTLDIAIPVRVSTQTVGGAQATKGTEAQGVLGPFNVISLSAIGAALVAIVALLIVWRRRRGRRPEAE
jgi:LPXTG-motif cell wall-anchored protein